MKYTIELYEDAIESARHYGFKQYEALGTNNNNNNTNLFVMKRTTKQ